MRTRVVLTAMTLAIGMLGIAASGQTEAQSGTKLKKLEEASIGIQVHDTDRDAAIQVAIGGEGFNYMGMRGPGGRLIDLLTDNGAAMKGITELFFESAEPSFDEQTLEEFLALFPEGEYEFEGTTTDGEPLTGSAMLTHNIPDAPVLVMPVDNAKNVDPADTVIEWMPVPDPAGSEIVGYEVIVEPEEPTLRVFSAGLGSDATSITVPPEFMEAKTKYKYGVQAIEASGNQTISERAFKTGKRKRSRPR